ncbi:hypothetical protein QQZ08_007931 [Neonectria magnoliae]|uniref:NmrA-like domain-containing protein n=1 Tax=Neonectria magnoliae TaxID=2732573 RepID=A0ABR1HWP8_9HYPO
MGKRFWQRRKMWLTPCHLAIRHLILTRATNLIGSGVLDTVLKIKDITKISILSRRHVTMAQQAEDARVNVITQKNFSHYRSDVLDQLKGASGVVWALGISQAKVSKEQARLPLHCEAEISLSEMRAVYPRLHTVAVGPGVVNASDHAAIRAYIPDQGLLCRSWFPNSDAYEIAAMPDRAVGQFLNGNGYGEVR